MEIRTMQSIELDILDLLKRGYVSQGIYRVQKQESREETIFTIQLKQLDEPFKKSWANSYNKEGIAYYNRIIDQGFSIEVREEGKLAGIAIAEPRMWNKSLFIWEFHVSTDFQRRGIGKKMMNYLDHEAREKDLRIMTCEVQNTNVPALDFYRNAGFELDGIDISLYSNDPGRMGEVAFFMKRKLE